VRQPARERSRRTKRLTGGVEAHLPMGARPRAPRQLIRRSLSQAIQKSAIAKPNDPFHRIRVHSAEDCRCLPVKITYLDGLTRAVFVRSDVGHPAAVR
jgi:hypothetical protein